MALEASNGGGHNGPHHLDWAALPDPNQSPMEADPAAAAAAAAQPGAALVTAAAALAGQLHRVQRVRSAAASRAVTRMRVLSACISACSRLAKDSKRRQRVLAILETTIPTDRSPQAVETIVRGWCRGGVSLGCDSFNTLSSWVRLAKGRRGWAGMTREPASVLIPCASGSRPLNSCRCPFFLPLKGPHHTFPLSVDIPHTLATLCRPSSWREHYLMLRPSWQGVSSGILRGQ